MVVAFYFRLHLAYFPRPVVAIFARPEHIRCLRTRYEADEAGQCCPYGAVYQERFGCLRDNKAKNKAKQGFRAIKKP